MANVRFRPKADTIGHRLPLRPAQRIFGVARAFNIGVIMLLLFPQTADAFQDADGEKTDLRDNRR